MTAKELTGPLVWLVGICLGALVLMFAFTDDATLRTRLVDQYALVVSFVLGLGGGGAVGGTLGYIRGKGGP